MAVKCRRRNVLCFSHDNLVGNGRRSSRYSSSELDLSYIASPKVGRKRRSVQSEKNSVSGKKKLKRVAHSNHLHSSFNDSPEKKQKSKNSEKIPPFRKILNSKNGERPADSSSTMTSIRRSQRHKIQRDLSEKLDESLSILLNRSIFTRSQKKLLNSNTKLSKKERPVSEICLKNPVTDLHKVLSRKGRSCNKERMDTSMKASEQTSLGNRKTPQQNENMSVNNVVDCLVSNHSSKTHMYKKVSQEKVKRRSPRFSGMYSEFGGKKYDPKFYSEKTSNRLKPVMLTRRRLKSFPVDDLVSPASMFISKKNNKDCASKFISNIIDLTKSPIQVQKISYKKGMEKEKLKSLPRKIIRSSKLTSTVDSKMSNNGKRKRTISNNLSVKDSNLIIECRTTRSSNLAGNNSASMISLSPKRIDKKSKRHTFPMRNANGKYISSQTHPRINQEMYDDLKFGSPVKKLNPTYLLKFKNVPIDDLIPPNSFYAYTDKSSRTKFDTALPIEHISVKSPIQNKNKVSSKSKKAVKLKKKQKTSNSQRKSSLGLHKSVPTKGTLKRKRWILNTLKEKSEGYEDDIFESRKFDEMKAALEMSDDESDTTDNSIATPKCGFILTPSLPKNTPMYKECISSADLLEARKSAEEYLYRRNKKWNSKTTNDLQNSSVNSSGTSEKDVIPEKKKLDYSEVLQNVIKAQKDIEKLTQEESEEEDVYFSDASD